MCQLNLLFLIGVRITKNTLCFLVIIHNLWASVLSFIYSQMLIIVAIKEKSGNFKKNIDFF